MSRALTPTARRAVYSSSSDEVFLTLLSISHDDLEDDLRFVADFQDIVSNGETYSACAFEYTLPDDIDGSVSSPTVTICNVDRSILTVVRTISTAPVFTISIVLASDPDTVEVGPYEYYLESVSYDALTITGTLTSNLYMDDNASTIRYSIKTFPGMFE